MGFSQQFLIVCKLPLLYDLPKVYAVGLSRDGVVSTVIMKEVQHMRLADGGEEGGI